MKRIIALLLCLSMLFSMVPVSTFAAEVEETTPVTEVATEPAETVPAETQSTEATEEEPSEETETPQESAEVTEAVTEAPVDDLAADLSATEETVFEETVTEFNWVPQGDLPSAEELFTGYVEKTFYGEASTYGTVAGNRLTGITKEIYNSMRPQIEEIAAGERSSASITVRGLDGNDLPSGFLTSLFNALLADLPYDLYWFDKTYGVSGSYGSDRDGLYITLSFYVSPHYSATGAAGTVNLDTSKTSAASAAAANALNVVAKYEDASDYEKLVGYKKEICSMTSYNSSAASSSYTGGYGDPWQLIWVFDRDSSTKVVCEGYTKAFQYLCDLSDFDADIVCYNVQGYMGNGGHMWNIVSINGKTYLADITNSDSGTVGASGGLFLVGKAPNSDGSYTFKSQKFTYGDATIEQWGLEEGSILILDTKDFDPDDLVVPPSADPSVMTGEELQEILNAASGMYFLSSTVEVTSELVIPENLFMAVDGDAAITVKSGGSITIPRHASLSVANGGCLTVEAGGTVTIEERGSLSIGGGTTVTVAGSFENNGSVDVNYGTLTITGTYSGDGSVEKDLAANITGINTGIIQLYSYAYDEATLMTQLVSHPEYASTTVYLMCKDENYDGKVDGPLTITQDVVVPEDVRLNLGYFIQDDQFILAEGASLTVNGTMIVIDTSVLTIRSGARLINNGYIANFGTISNNGTFKGNGHFQQDGTLTGNDILTGDSLILDDFLTAVANAEKTGESVHIFDTVTLAEDLTINMTSLLSFEADSKLVVPGGVTLTVQGPISFNDAQLLVEEGGSLILNGDLTINDYSGSGAVAVIDGSMFNYGTIWLVEGGDMRVSGTLESYNAMYVGLGSNGATAELAISGSATTYGYLNIAITTGLLTVEEGGELIIAGALYDNGEPYTNGYLDVSGAVTVNGSLRINGGFTLNAPDGSAQMTIGSNGELLIPSDNMWFDVENAVLTNEGTITNDAIIENSGTIVNLGTVNNNGQIRLFDTGTYDSDNGVHSGNEAMDGAAAQWYDFQTDLRDGNGATLSSDLTLPENLTVNLGEDHLVIRSGATLYIPDGTTLTLNSHVQVDEAVIWVEEGGELIINTDVNIVSGGGMGFLINRGHVTINDGGALWLDDGATLDVGGTGIVDVVDDPATDAPAAIHVSHFAPGGTVRISGELNTGGYVNVMPGGWFILQEDAVLNILNNETGCGYLDVAGMAQLNGKVNLHGLLSVSNKNENGGYTDGTARIEVNGTVTGFDNSAIFVSPNASISVSAPALLETTGEVTVEKDGTLWVDGDAMFSGPTPITNYGNIHVNHFLDDSDYNGCLILDCDMTNYGYLNIGQRGTIFINGRLDIAQTEVDGESFAGYLNGFGNVIISGLVNNNALMDINADGYVEIEDSGVVNVQNSIFTTVGPNTDLILNGTLNIHPDNRMNIFGNVTGYGTWDNAGTIHFGVAFDEELGEAFYGNTDSFYGSYLHNAGTLEVELFESEPISVDMLPAQFQTLVYTGSYADAIRTVLANEEYQTRVTLTDDVTLSENMTVGYNAVLEIQSNVTIAEGTVISAYGPVIISDGGVLNVEGTLKLFHPSGTMTVLKNGTVNVPGKVFNGTSVTVHGALDIGGTWEGYFPNAVEGGSITGEGAPSDYEIFLYMTRVAAAEGYPVVLSSDLVIPEYTDISCDLIVESGVTLTLNGNLAIWGSLTVEEGATIINNAGLSRENTGHITVAEGSVVGNGTVYNACANAEDYEIIQGIPMDQQSLLVMMCTSEETIRSALPLAEGYKDATLLVRHDVTLTSDLTIPANATLRLYRDFDEEGEVIPCTFTIPEGTAVTNKGTFIVDNHSTLILNGSFAGNQPQVNDGGSIEGDYTKLSIRQEFKVQPSFLEDGSEPGLWAGAKMSFSPVLYRTLTGEEVTSGNVQVTVNPGYEQYATIAQSGNLITVTANKSLAEHQIIAITFTAENAAPTTLNLHLRPKATGADVLLNDKTVTGQIVLADLNRGDNEFQLSATATPADAVPENGTTANGGSLVTWKSSNTGIATVAADGTVTFTGNQTGKVKITATANYGAAKTAVVTFNVVKLPTAIKLGAENPTKLVNVDTLIGGSSATFTAVDASEKSAAVKWFLCTENGTPLSAHPYASITAAGKLTTKAVADETKVYMMAQVVGDERSAYLDEPVCVTLFPALTYAQILLEGINVNNATLLYDVIRNDRTCQLGWAAGPYEESVKSVEWKSSKPAIASIDKNSGLITLAEGVTSGTAKFTLTVVGRNNKKLTAAFTVNFGVFTQDLKLSATLPDSTVTDDVSDLVISGGEILTFSGKCLPNNVTTGGITWSLDSKTYGSISSTGVLKTKPVTNPTTITVRAASKDGAYACDIDVTLMPKQGSLFIWNDSDQFLTNSTYTMMANSNMVLSASKTPVTWSSSDSLVAAVNSNGVVTALKKGIVTITATAADGSSASFTLKVDKLSERVEITTKNGGALVATSGKALELIATVDYSDGSYDSKNVIWSLTDLNGNPVPKTVATISTSGKLSAAKGLTTAIPVCVYADAKDGNSFDCVSVEIVPATTAIEVFGPFGESGADVDVSNMVQSWNLNDGMEISLSARAFPGPIENAVNWKSSSSAIATIDNDGNVTFTGNKTGAVTFTATAKDGSGKKATLKLNVVKTMTRLELPETAAVGGSQSLTFTKMDGYAIDTQATNQTLKWILTDIDGNSVPTSMATLSNKGVLKTKAVTQPVQLIVRAEATDGSSLFDECTVTVWPLVTAVAISNAPAELYVSSSVDLDAVCTPSGAAQDVTWKTSNDSIATVDADGVVTALKTGNVTITATAADGSGKKATAKIKIMDPPAPENVQISMIAAQYGPDSAQWWADFEKQYEAATPNVDLVVDVVSWNDIYTVVNTRIANGQGPDILNLDSFADFQADGLLLPVKDYMSNATYSKFFPEFLNESKINGTVWAVPDLTSARALYYNATLLAELGIEVPETWDELVEAAQNIKAFFGGNIIPFGIDMTTDEGQATFALYTWNNGGGFLDANGNWYLNSAENVETVEFLRNMVFDGLTNSDPTVTTRYDLQDMLGSGQVAMTIAPCGIENWGYNVDLAAAPIPTNTGKSVSLAVMDRMMCFDNDYTSAELAAITSFFDLFYEDERHAAWVNMEGFLPATSTGCDALAELDPDKAVWGDILASAKFYPTEKDDWYDVRMGVIDVLQRALLGGNVSNLLNNLQQEISGESAPVANEISLWVYPIGDWGNSATVSNLISSFEEETGTRVKVTYMNYADGDTMIETALAGGTAPDLVLEGPERLTANWGARGVMVNLADMFDSTDKAEILPAALDAFTSRSGAVYGYPLIMTTHCMAINRTVFEAAGAMKYIDEDTHTWTTENFLKAVNAVYAYTGKTVGAVYCGGQGGDQGTRALVTNLHGGSYTNADHTAYTWDAYENVAALKTLYDCDGIVYNPVIVGGDEIALFRSGVLNMAFCWNIAQQMTSSTTDTGDEIMFMSFPSPNGTDAELQSGVWGFGIFNSGNNARTQAAKQFVKYCCDSKATADAVRTSNYFPVRSSAEGNSLANLWADNAIMQEYSILTPMMGDYYQVTPNWAVARTNWWNMLQLVSEYGYSEEMIASIAREYTFFSNNQ